jgi:hypothetical protein
MKKLIVVLCVLSLLVPLQSIDAKELEPDKLPRWATPDCILTISKIVQHETGNMKSDEVFRFMTEQIIHDLTKFKCSELTKYRWAIGLYPEYKVTSQVKNSVLDVVYKWPHTEFPNCNFIGNKGDLKVWKSYGYDITIGYSKTINKLTVVGVGCNGR